MAAAAAAAVAAAARPVGGVWVGVCACLTGEEGSIDRDNGGFVCVALWLCAPIPGPAHASRPYLDGLVTWTANRRQSVVRRLRGAWRDSLGA